MSKKSIKIKAILAGVFLILFAIYLVVNALGYIPGSIPVFKVALSLLLTMLFVDGCIHLNFVEMIMPIAVVLCLFREELALQALPIWMIILVGALISAGACLIKNTIIGHKGPVYESSNNNVIDGDCADGPADCQFSTNDSNVNIAGSVGNQTHYINGNTFETGTVTGGVGNLTLYFVGTEAVNKESRLHVQGGVGNILIHIPASWRASISGKPGMGDLKVKGTPNTNPEAPIIFIDIAGGVGNVKIFFD